MTVVEAEARVDGQNMEAALAARLMAGDGSAFDAFVERFRTKIFRYSFLNCGRRDEAEEVVQETLLKVFQNFGQLQDAAHVKAWVFRIAKNACLERRRRSVFAPERELSLDELRPGAKDDGRGLKFEIADWRIGPEQEAYRGELHRMVEEAVRELPEAYRSVLLLRDVEELPAREVAEVLEISEDLVRTRLHRARLAVRKGIEARLRAREAR
jgi:RNA polymerase sigma-70 factor (ECF subfamily)